MADTMDSVFQPTSLSAASDITDRDLLVPPAPDRYDGLAVVFFFAIFISRRIHLL